MLNFKIPLPNFEIFLVGGFVRDHLLGVPSKDIDIVCEAASFEEMSQWVEATHKKIFLSKPEFLTIRALTHNSEAFDYVLARNDGAYSDGRHPDSVSIGSISQDLARRDFTVNAMAYNIRSGSLFDPHGGFKDLQSKTLTCVGNTEERLSEDPLRLLRAMRFSLTKGFNPDEELMLAFQNPIWSERIIETVSEERIREELKKCFFYDTSATLEFLMEVMSPVFRKRFFKSPSSGSVVWLEPTNKSK